jgi:hypothetical protein
MLSILQESKIKQDLQKEQYEAMIKQYRNDIRDYGTKIHIEYVNNYFNPDIMIDKIFSILDSNPGSNYINCDINQDISLEINLYDLIKQKYINNEFKFKVKDYNICYSKNKNLIDSNLKIKVNKVFEYCNANNINCDNKFLFGKTYSVSNCVNTHNYERYKHWCYLYCANCCLSIYKNKYATRNYKNNDSIYNNIVLDIDVKLQRKADRCTPYYYNYYMYISINCDITNLYKINKKYDDIIKLFPIIQMKLDRIINSSNEQDKINYINEKLPLIRDNKLNITDVENIYNMTIQLDKKLENILNPSRGIFSMLFKRNQLQTQKQTFPHPQNTKNKPPEYDTISIKTIPPPYVQNV